MFSFSHRFSFDLLITYNVNGCSFGTNKTNRKGFAIISRKDNYYGVLHCSNVAPAHTIESIFSVLVRFFYVAKMQNRGRVVRVSDIFLFEYAIKKNKEKLEGDFWNVCLHFTIGRIGLVTSTKLKSPSWRTHQIVT